MTQGGRREEEEEEEGGGGRRRWGKQGGKTRDKGTNETEKGEGRGYERRARVRNIRLRERLGEEGRIFSKAA